MTAKADPKFSGSVRTVRSLRYENILVRYGMGIMACTIAFQGFLLASRPRDVVLVPPFQTEAITFTEGRANSEYYKQWAWSIAMMVGNISPGNADFVKGEVEKMVTPDLYRRMVQKLEADLDSLKSDSAVVTFAPSEVTFDPKLDLYFVSGQQTISGPARKTDDTKQVTFEMSFVSDRLRIRVASFTVYDGPPLTAEMRNEILDQREREAAAAEGTGK